jgi:hypothetical protein
MNYIEVNGKKHDLENIYFQIYIDKKLQSWINTMDGEHYTPKKGEKQLTSVIVDFKTFLNHVKNKSKKYVDVKNDGDIKGFGFSFKSISNYKNFIIDADTLKTNKIIIKHQNIKYVFDVDKISTKNFFFFLDKFNKVEPNLNNILQNKLLFENIQLNDDIKTINIF